MRSLARRSIGPFEIAVAFTVVCVATSVVVALLLSPPSTTELDYSYPGELIRFQAFSAFALLILGVALRSRQEAASYGCFAAACVLSGWAAQGIWQNSIDVRDPQFAVGLLFRLSAITATAAVLAAFAATPARRLDRRTPAALALLVGATAAAAGFETLIEAGGWTGEYFSIEQVAFVDLLISPMPLLVILAVVAAGSLRNEALRYRPGGEAAAPTQSESGALRWAVAVACVAGLVVAIVGLANPPSEGLRWTFLPLLAGLIAVVAGRWSTLVAWSSVAISFSATAAAIAFAVLDAAVSEYVSRYDVDPATQWAPGPVYWIEVAGVALIGVVALAAASRALRAARRARAGQASRATVPPRVVVGIGVAVVGWGTLATYFSSTNPVWVLPVFAMFTASLVLTGLLSIAVAEAARGRLVPAIAEAEAMATRPFLPLRYLETAAGEALTGRSSLRRTATAAERSRLASDLHAGLLPALAAITAQSEAGAPSAELVVRLRRLEDEVRDLMAERRLVVLEEFGLVEAIEWLLGRAEERQSLEVNLSVDDQTTAERPPREVERAAFRIAQLAVENALQHAAPKRLVLEVLARSDAVRVSVADDGRGVATATGNPGRDRFGIADMRSQAAGVRGDIQVVAPPAGGTTVTFAWPAV